MGDVVGSFVWIVKRDFVYRPLAVASDPAVATIRPRIIDHRTVDVYPSIVRKLKAIGGRNLWAAIARARLRLNCLSGLRKAEAKPFQRRRSEISRAAINDGRFCASDPRYRREQKLQQPIATTE